MSNYSLHPTNNHFNFNSNHNMSSSANASMIMPSVSVDRRSNHQQGAAMTTQNGEPFLKDWEVTVTGYSNKDVAGLAEYNSVKELIDRNGGRIHTNLLLTTTHVIGRKGSTEKCVAAWEHNKKLLLAAENNNNRRKNVANSYKEILVVIPEYVPAFLNHRFEVEELLLAEKKKQEKDLINNGNDKSNHEDEPEAKNPQQLLLPQQQQPYNENDDNLPSLLRRDEDEIEQNSVFPELNIEPYLVKPLTGFTISYTGYPEHARAELEARIQFLGGEVSRAMTGDIDYLLVPSGVEIPVDLGGICSQQPNNQNNHVNVASAISNQLNMEKLRLADASKIDIVYCEYFLSVLAEKKQTIQQVAKLAKVKRGKMMSMSQSLHATTQKILGGTSSSIHNNNNNNNNNTSLTLSTIVAGNGLNNSFSSSTNPFLSMLNLSQQPQITSNSNNQNLQTDSAPCSQPQRNNSNNNNNNISSGSVHSSPRASISPFVTSQQVSPTSNNNNNAFPPAPAPPPPFTISPQLLSEFATFTQDAIVCALFTTDDQLRNLTWLMNTLAIPVVTIPSAHKINETVFLLGTELDPVYHDTVKKYFERQFNISDFIRSAFCLHLWLNSVAELMMNFSTVSNQIDELEKNRKLGEEEEQKIQEKLREIEQNENDDDNNNNNQNSEELLLRNNRQIIQEFLEQLHQQRSECLAIRDKIEAQVSAIFSRDQLQPAKSLDNHPVLFPNHTMSYLGWVEHENERHGNNNSMLYSSQQQSYRRNSYYSQVNFKDGGYHDDDDLDNHNSEGIHLPSQHFDVSKMVSRILAKSQFSQQNNHNNNNSNNNSNAENGTDPQQQQKQTSPSNNITKNSTIQVSRNPATKTMFSHLFFVIDGAMTEECLRLTKHAVHLGGGKYSTSGNSINNNNEQNNNNNSAVATITNTYFVISHSCQRLWGEPSLKENERRQKGYSQDVTLDWLLHCLSFGKFVDPKLCFAFNTPVNKIQLHHLPTPGTASNHGSVKRGNMMKNFSQTRGAMDTSNSFTENTNNNNSNATSYIASCYVSEPRKYFKKQIQHVGVVAFVPQCGEFAQMVDVFSNVITLLGGNSIKLTDPTFSHNNGIVPTEASQKLTHIIFPKGNWLDLKSAISSSRLNSPLIQSQETNPNSNGSRIRQRTVSILDDDHHQNDLHKKKNNNNNGIAHKLTSSSTEKEIVQHNIEWLASAISCLPSDHTKKMIPQPNSASTNQSQHHHHHRHHHNHQNNQPKLNPNLLYIVSSEWLDVSARAGYFVDETQFLVEAKLTSSTTSSSSAFAGLATNKAKNNNNNNNNNPSMTQLVNNTQNMTSSQVAEKLEKSGILFDSGNTQNGFFTQQPPEANKMSKNITNNFIVIPHDKSSNSNQASNNSHHHHHHHLSNENSNSNMNNKNILMLPSQLSDPSVPDSLEMSRFMVAIEAEHSQQQMNEQQHQHQHHQNLFLMIDESPRINPDGATSSLPPLVELDNEQERIRVSDNASSANHIRSSFFDEVEEDINEELPSKIDESIIIVESESQRNCSFTREEDLLPVFQEEENRRSEHEENESKDAPQEDIPPPVLTAEQTSNQEQKENLDAAAIVVETSQRNDDQVAEMIFEEKNNFEDVNNNDQSENHPTHDPLPPRNSITTSGRPSAALVVNRYSTTSLFAKSARNSTRPSFHPPVHQRIANDNNGSNTQHQNAFVVDREDSDRDKNVTEDSALLLLPRNSFFSRETWNIFGDGAHLVSGKKVQLLLSATSDEQEVLKNNFQDDNNNNNNNIQQQHLRKVEFMETTDLDLAHIVVHSRISQTGIILASIAARKWICTTELIQNILAAHHFSSHNSNNNKNNNNNNNNNSHDPLISRGIIFLPKFEWTSKIVEDNYQQAVIALRNSKNNNNNTNNKQELDKEIQLLKKTSQLQKNVVESAIYWRKTLSDFTDGNTLIHSSAGDNSSSSSQPPFAHIKAMFWLTPKKDKMVETQEREEVLSRIIESGGGQVTKFDLPLTVATDVANFLRFRGSEVGICHLFVSDEVLNDPYVNQMESLVTLCGALNKNGGQSIPANNSHHNNNNINIGVNTARSRSPPPPQRRRIEVFSESYLSKVLLRKALPVPTYLYVSTIQQN